MYTAIHIFIISWNIVFILYAFLNISYKYIILLSVYNNKKNKKQKKTSVYSAITKGYCSNPKDQTFLLIVTTYFEI